MVKIVCRYLCWSLRNRDANIEDRLKKGSNFEQRERNYPSTLGSGSRARGLKSLQKQLYYFFGIYNNLIPLHFHLYAILKLQLNWEFTILPFSGP